MFKSLRNSLKHSFARALLLALAASFLTDVLAAQTKSPNFRVIALAEHGGIHKPFVDAAKIWLAKLASENNFTVAFIKYIEQGKGGWIGFHHATLLGEFDGYQIWPWFQQFMGGIRFRNYIATFVSGSVTVEDKNHPAMKDVPSPFVIEKEEWYTYDTSPRPNVHVLASVDEKTYTPSTDLKMGDHPVIWTNEHFKARNIYIFMGHRPGHFDNPAFTKIFRNSIFWAAGQQENR